MATKILSETPISMTDLKEELQKIKKRDGELNFRANKTEEYLGLFVTLTPEQAKELKEKLAGLNIPRLKEEHILKIIDIMPSTIEELKSVLSGYTITVNNDNMKKIYDVVSNYLPKKK
jgi:DNA-directed RNA polymerase subunit F